MRTICSTLILMVGLATSVAAQNRRAAAQVVLTGTLDVLVVDHHTADASGMAYFIREDARGRVFELKFTASIQETCGAVTVSASRGAHWATRSPWTP